MPKAVPPLSTYQLINLSTYQLINLSTYQLINLSTYQLINLSTSLHQLLDEKVAQYNTPDFIAGDPVSVPHRFSKKEDIEIAALFAAVLAWGSRTTIINNCSRLMSWMGNEPHRFILEHQPEDLKPFVHFVHRTFNATDLLYFIHFLQEHYRKGLSLEDAFVPEPVYEGETVESALLHFRNYFFSLEHPERTMKHVATPARGSACKRLCMLLRWMVRSDKAGVDFGLWKKIRPAQLVCPVDVHVARVSQRLGLLEGEAVNWKTALALTAVLRSMRPDDPAVYDFALFGLGAEERW